MAVTVALVGNPNSGKTTLFNALTGANQFVGNWPGVTVDRKEGKFKLDKNKDSESVNLVDLPGIYSLSPYSQEEVIARDYIINDKPDVVINIVDASNMERNLYLTTQVMELGVPVVVALNMCDVVKRKGEKLDAKALEKELGCPVVEISAIKKTGIKELKKALQDVINKEYELKTSSFKFSNDINFATEDIKKIVNDSIKDINGYGALKVLTNDSLYLSNVCINEDELGKVEAIRKQLEEKYEDDIESIVAEQRYQWIGSIIDKVIIVKRKEKISLSDKIDKVLTNRWLGLPIFLLVIYLIYFICLHPQGLGKLVVKWCFTGIINVILATMGAMTSFGCSPWLIDFVCNGVMFAVGIVIAFIPYLMILFFFMALLEESGYMARVAFIMDRLFRRFGLSGKSFIPMLLGTGCTVQAVANVRTIEDPQDRKMTIFLTPLMPCATKMPMVLMVATFMAGAAGAAWIAPLVYVVAIVYIICAGLFLKHTKFKGEPAPFVMELPEYKFPRPLNVLHYVWTKTLTFFKKVTTIILVSTVIIWFFKYFTFDFTHSNEFMSDSMLAGISNWLCPLFAPIGLDNWKLVASMLTGMVAKDNCLSTMLTLQFGNIAAQPDFDPNTLLETLPTIFTTASQGISFLIFYCFSSPCFSAMGAISKELGDRKLTFQAIAFHMGSAYLVSMVVYNFLRIFGV